MHAKFALVRIPLLGHAGEHETQAWAGGNELAAPSLGSIAATFAAD